MNKYYEEDCEDIEYRGWVITYNFYGNGEYIVCRHGYDNTFDTLREAEKYIDSIKGPVMKMHIDLRENTSQLISVLYDLEKAANRPFAYADFKKRLRERERLALAGAGSRRAFRDDIKDEIRLRLEMM